MNSKLNKYIFLCRERSKIQFNTMSSNFINLHILMLIEMICNPLFIIIIIYINYFPYAIDLNTLNTVWKIMDNDLGMIGNSESEQYFRYNINCYYTFYFEWIIWYGFYIFSNTSSVLFLNIFFTNLFNTIMLLMLRKTFYLNTIKLDQ